MSFKILMQFAVFILCPNLYFTLAVIIAVCEWGCVGLRGGTSRGGRAETVMEICCISAREARKFTKSTLVFLISGWLCDIKFAFVTMFYYCGGLMYFWISFVLYHLFCLRRRRCTSRVKCCVGSTKFIEKCCIMKIKPLEFIMSNYLCKF